LVVLSYTAQSVYREELLAEVNPHSGNLITIILILDSPSMWHSNVLKSFEVYCGILCSVGS